MTELDWMLVVWCVIAAYASWLLIYLIVDYLRMSRRSGVIVRTPSPITERRSCNLNPTPLVGERR